MRDYDDIMFGHTKKNLAINFKIYLMVSSILILQHFVKALQNVSYIFNIGLKLIF